MLLRIFVLSLLLATPLVWAGEPICKVIDGDTFHFCNGLKVRLDAIDAPERNEPLYWESRKALANLLQTRDIRLTHCHTDDTGKRQACGVFADGKDIQAELVRAGLAWDWPKYSGGRYRVEEAQAKAAKLGIWVNDKATAIHWATRER